MACASTVFAGGALKRTRHRARQYSPAHISGRYYAEERRRCKHMPCFTSEERLSTLQRRLHQRNSCSHYSHCRHVDVKSLLQIQHALVVDATLFTADEHVDPELRAKMCAVALRGIDHLLLDGRNRELALRE